MAKLRNFDEDTRGRTKYCKSERAAIGKAKALLRNIEQMEEGQGSKNIKGGLRKIKNMRKYFAGEKNLSNFAIMFGGSCLPAP